jgi:hypothetical protein
MIHFNGNIIGTNLIWELIRYDDDYIDDGITISFPLPIQLNEREAINYLKIHLPETDNVWLTFTAKKWIIDLTGFKAEFYDGIVSMLSESDAPEIREPNVTYLGFRLPTKLSLEILEGTIDVQPEVSHRDVRKTTNTTVNFIFTYDNIMDNKPKRIFLSHKSADKPLVRAYKEMLKALGFEPWMDEDDLSAGDKLHRGILQGFKDSCAAIFFITENYVDENYLATEIDYAMDEHYKKKKHFKIITLVMSEDTNTIVPELLKQFVYKSPKSQFEALTEIVKALPIKWDSISYKS